MVLVYLFCNTEGNNVTLNLLNNVNLIVLIFIFRLRPNGPPISIVLIVVTIITTSTALRTSNNLSIVLRVTRGLLHHGPGCISVITPFIAYALAVLYNANRIICAVLPVVCSITVGGGVHPRHPVTTDSVNTRVKVVTDPISITIISLITVLNGIAFSNHRLRFLSLLTVAVPSALVNVLTVNVFD